MNNKFKSLLSQIKIAQIKRKQSVYIKLQPYFFSILNILWRNGFIYSYSQTKTQIIVFLKYNEQGIGLLKNMNLKKKEIVRLHQVNTCSVLNPNNVYILLTQSGFYLNKTCLLQKLGGFIIVKI